MILDYNIVYSKDKNGVYLSYYDFSLTKLPPTQSISDIIGKTDYDLYPKEIADMHYAQDQIVLKDGRNVYYQAELMHHTAFACVCKQPLLDANGKIIGIIANINNYTAIYEQYQADCQTIKDIVKETTGNVVPDNLKNIENVEYLRDYLKNIIAMIPGHVYWYNPDNILIGCNNLQAKSLGLKSTQDVVGKTLYDLLPLHQANKLQELNEQIIKTGDAHIIEERVVMANGPGVYLSHKVPLRDSQQRIVGILGISFDITDRKKAEEERLNLVLKASNMGIWAWDFTNNTFSYDYIHHEQPYHFHGNLEEVITRAHPDDQKTVRDAMLHARHRTAPLDIEYRCTWVDGKMRYIAMRGKVLEDRQGKATSMVGVCWDITSRKQLENAIHQQQIDLAQIARLNAMGELASTLAHELNQPLAAISNYMKGCVIRLQSGNYRTEDLLEAMRNASAQSIRAGEIIHRMKNFVRKGKLYYETTNINTIINETVSIMKYEPTANQISIQLELAEKLPELQADKIQIGQVVSNLLRNAIEAMQQQEIKEPKVIVKTIQNNQEIYVDIIDNGPGCPNEIASQLFNPYFTTKKNGMGMGLAICRTIIEAHNGNLTLLPNPNSGAWFRFSLPLVKKTNLEH